MSSTVKFTKLDKNGNVVPTGYLRLVGNQIEMEPSDSILLRNVLLTADQWDNVSDWFNQLYKQYRSPYLSAYKPTESDNDVETEDAGGREPVGLDWPSSASGSESALATGPRSVFNQRTHREP